MRDLVDQHRGAISAAAAERDVAFANATQTFHDAAEAYRDAMEKATDEYNSAVTASEVGLHAEMQVRSNAFFGHVPVKEPVITVRAPTPDASAPDGFSERFTVTKTPPANDGEAAEIGGI